MVFVVNYAAKDTIPAQTSLDVRQKVGGYCAPSHWEAASPSNTMWPGSRPTSMRSFILIHPTVWPQYTNVPDRQTTDNGPTG